MNTSSSISRISTSDKTDLTSFFPLFQDLLSWPTGLLLHPLLAVLSLRLPSLFSMTCWTSTHTGLSVKLEEQVLQLQTHLPHSPSLWQPIVTHVKAWPGACRQTLPCSSPQVSLNTEVKLRWFRLTAGAYRRCKACRPTDLWLSTVPHTHTRMYTHY